MKTTSLFILISYSILWVSCGNNSGNTENKKGAIPTAEVFIIQQENIAHSLELMGSLLPQEEIELSVEIQGRLENILFKEGAKVTKGQLLVKINDADLKARLMQVNAKLNPEEKKLDRLKILVKSGGVSIQEVEESEALIADLKAEKVFLQSQIDKTEIRAPWEGSVGIRYVSEGAIVAPGNRIATLRQLSKVKVEFKIPEKYAGAIKPGNRFELRTDYLGENPIMGFVNLIEPAIEESTRSLLIRGSIENKNELLLPGTSARISLNMDTIRNAFMVPDRAIKPVLRGKELAVLKEGKVIFIPVTTGIRTSQYTQVSGEIQHGDTILTTGMMQVKPGVQVDIIKIETKAK